MVLHAQHAPLTTCEEPSGKVYVVRETLVKSLRRARNLDRVWSGRYDVRGTVRESLRRARNLGQVATTNRRGKFTSYEKPWSSRYDVRGTLIGFGMVVMTCEEPSGKVYVMRETLVKSLRCARNLDRVWSGLPRAEEPWSVPISLLRSLGRYDMRGTIGASLRRARNLGQVVYDVLGTLIESGLVYDGPRNLDRLRSRFLGALVVYDVPRNVD
ncbi:hypothetical protein Tco_0379723 [Tanacetum coccineum]